MKLCILRKNPLLEVMMSNWQVNVGVFVDAFILYVLKLRSKLFEMVNFPTVLIINDADRRKIFLREERFLHVAKIPESLLQRSML